MSNQPKLTWTRRPNTSRADSDVGGYWITWTEYAGWSIAMDPRERRWCNAYCIVDGATRSVAAGNQREVKRDCELHYAKRLAATITSPDQKSVNL